MKKETETNLRILRTDPLKMNIRVWFGYLQTALNWNGKLGFGKSSKFQFQVNKEYYRAWHLNQVRTLKFDKWWKNHEHLFSDKNYVSVRVLDSLSVEDAFKQVKKQLINKVGKTKAFQITNSRFRYLQVDDYLKCFRGRNEKGLSYYKIGIRMLKDYHKKELLYSKSTKLLKRKFTNKTLEKWLLDNTYATEFAETSKARTYGNRHKLLTVVRRKVLNAEKILENTAKGQFTGKY